MRENINIVREIFNNIVISILFTIVFVLCFNIGLQIFDYSFNILELLLMASVQFLILSICVIINIVIITIISHISKTFYQRKTITIIIALISIYFIVINAISPRYGLFSSIAFSILLPIVLFLIIIVVFKLLPFILRK